MMSPLRGALGPLGVSAGAAVASNGLLTGLVAYWALDEAAGANDALDKHSGGLTLTQVSSPGSAAGKVYAGARTFDGSSQYFSRASGAAIQTGGINFAVAAWFYRAAGGVGIILARDNGGTEREFMLSATDTGTNFVCYPADAYTSAASGIASTGGWHLLIGWRDGGTIYSQLDGAAAIAQACAAHDNGAVETTVGRPGYANYLFNGRIGPVAFWKNRTLDAAARAALWNGGNGLAYSAFTA